MPEPAGRDEGRAAAGRRRQGQTGRARARAAAKSGATPGPAASAARRPVSGSAARAGRRRTAAVAAGAEARTQVAPTPPGLPGASGSLRDRGPPGAAGPPPVWRTEAAKSGGAGECREAGRAACSGSCRSPCSATVRLGTSGAQGSNAGQRRQEFGVARRAAAGSAAAVRAQGADHRRGAAADPGDHRGGRRRSSCSARCWPSRSAGDDSDDAARRCGEERWRQGGFRVRRLRRRPRRTRAAHADKGAQSGGTRTDGGRSPDATPGHTRRATGAGAGSPNSAQGVRERVGVRRVCRRTRTGRGSRSDCPRGGSTSPREPRAPGSPGPDGQRLLVGWTHDAQERPRGGLEEPRAVHGALAVQTGSA